MFTLFITFLHCIIDGGHESGILNSLDMDAAEDMDRVSSDSVSSDSVSSDSVSSDSVTISVLPLAQGLGGLNKGVESLLVFASGDVI